jgi:hypothetical protein
MKVLIILFIYLYGITISIWSQTNNLSHSLFEDYQNALIFYKDGRQFQAPINFNLLEGHYLFIDAKDKEAKQFSNPELIALLRIGERRFLIGDKEAIEIIQTNPLFQVRYSGNLRQAPKKLTYGGTTQTAPVDNYSRMIGNNLQSSISQNQIVKGVNKTYEIKVGKKTKRFFSKNSFLKAVPKQFRSDMESYLMKNEVDFENVQQVLELYRHLTEKIQKK